VYIQVTSTTVVVWLYYNFYLCCSRYSTDLECDDLPAKKEQCDDVCVYYTNEAQMGANSYSKSSLEYILDKYDKLDQFLETIRRILHMGFRLVLIYPPPDVPASQLAVRPEQRF
jgi:hypothetical protein